MMSENPKVNQGWVGRDGFEAVIREASVTVQWFDALNSVATRIERDKFTFHQTSIREF